jgi:hypothetical protein
MHGVLSSAQDMSDLKALILTKIPKAEIYLMDIFDGISSFKPVWEQVALYKTQLASFNVTGPYNVITHSQGMFPSAFRVEWVFVLLDGMFETRSKD